MPGQVREFRAVFPRFSERLTRGDSRRGFHVPDIKSTGARGPGRKAGSTSACCVTFFAFAWN